MRADYLTRFGPEFKGGFKKLLNEGAVFDHATVNFVPTETGPGHAAISTGRPPAVNGIIGNFWWDRVKGKGVSASMFSRGRSGPDKLLGPTLSDAVKKKNPASRALAMSMKQRAAVLLGGRTPDFALWFNADKGVFVSSGLYSPLPDWVNEFKRQHFQSPAESDRFLSELAERAALRMSLGKGGAPDLLMVSFSGTDAVGHAHGPESAEMRSQILEIDKILGAFIQYLSEDIGPGNFDLALTADHGVAPVPGSWEGRKIGARHIRENDFTANLNGALRNFPSLAGENWISGIYLPNIYLNRGLAARKKIGWKKFLAKARLALKLCDGVAEVYDPAAAQPKDEFWPQYSAGYHKDRGGDLMIRLKEGVVVEHSGTKTTHGSPYYYDNDVPLIFWGADFKTGRYEGAAHIIDVAPTLAKILNVDLPPGSGSRILTEALKP